MKKIYLYLILFSITAFFHVAAENPVIATKRITLEEYPDAFNPSIIKRDYGYLLIFRYCPDRTRDNYSFLGVVELDESFDPISTPQILDSRFGDTTIPSHSEDARVFTVREKVFLSYNDNPVHLNPTAKDRRDIYIAELIENDGQYTLVSPLKLVYPTKFETQNWQKNWVPFEWNGNLLIGYSILPHEVLLPNLETGTCCQIGVSKMNFSWDYGILRGGTPAQLVGDQYMAFFHSSSKMISDVSDGENLLHYFMGAYTFSPEPPFGITKISVEPIIDDSFYSETEFSKRVVFPGGFVVSGDLIYLAYGKNDREIWIATLDKNIVEASLITVKSK